MNEYDSAKMRDVLMKSHGFVVTENPEEADVEPTSSSAAAMVAGELDKKLRL
jgi:hypothetical protein